MNGDGRWQSFVLRATRLQRPPHVPEIQLYLADEVMPIWHMVGEELGETDVSPPFWAFAWPGGLAIARYLLDGGEDVRRKRVLDFATGSGLCAIAAAKAGAAQVLAVDVDPLSRAAVTLNAEANGVDVTFIGDDLLATEPPETDLLLAGDVCYEEPLAGRVQVWLGAAHERGTRVLIGDPGRAYLRREGLIRLAGYGIQTTRELEDREIKWTDVFTFPA